jgi:hypothetical protein
LYMPQCILRTTIKKWNKNKQTRRKLRVYVKVVSSF